MIVHCFDEYLVFLSVGDDCVVSGIEGLNSEDVNWEPIWKKESILIMYDGSTVGYWWWYIQCFKQFSVLNVCSILESFRVQL